MLVSGPKCSLYTAASESYDNPNPYNLRLADIFSVGCCLLTILLGAIPYVAVTPPLDGSDERDVCRLKRNINVTQDLIRPFDYNLRQVLLKLLDPIPDNRISIEQFLADPWFTTRIHSEDDSNYRRQSRGQSHYSRERADSEHPISRHNT